MDYRQFKTFIIAAEELHFGRAAERLDIAQPAVTQQIKALEQQLGFRLFQRVGRGVGLTEAGRTFLEHAKLSLATMDAAVLAGRRASRGELGRLSIAYVQSAMLEPELPALLQRFSQASPDVEIALHDISVQQQVDALSDESIDLAFLRAPCGTLPNTINLTPFSKTPLDAVLPDGHALARRPRFTLRHLSEERFIIVNDPPGIGLGHRALALCLEAGVTPKHVMRVSDALTVVRLVAAGLGVGIAPRSLKRYGTEGCVFRPLPMANQYSEIVIATRAFDRSAMVKQMLKLASA